MKTRVALLSNGMTVHLKESRGAPVVALQLWVKVGAADETPTEAGLAHVLEHMLFKGTARRGVGQIARDVESAGGYINAWTSHDETVFHITLASAFAEQGLDVLCDAVAHSSLDAAELARELQVILEEIRMGQDSASRVTTEKLFAGMYRTHPYGRPVIGSERTVRRFTREMVHHFYRKWYVPSNMLLVIVGDFDIDKMMGLVERYAGTIENSGPAPGNLRMKEPPQARAREIHGMLPVSEVNVAMGFPVPGLDHPDVAALDVLAAVLGQGASSRMETEIRRKKGLATDVRALSFTPRDGGVFGIFGTTPAHKLIPFVEEVARSLMAVTREPILSREVEKARALLLSEDIYAEETVDGIARKTGYFALHSPNPDFERQYLAALSIVGPEQLKEVARRYFLPSRLTISSVHPDPARRTSRREIAWVSEQNGGRHIDKDILRKELLSAFKRGAAPPARTISRRRPLDTVVHTLRFGDTLIVRPDPAARVVAARAAFLGGLRNEPAARGGLVSLFSAGLTRGTESRSASDVGHEMDALACSISGFSGRNTVGIYGEFLSSNFSSGVALMGDCLRNSVFPDEEMEREKNILLEEILADRDSAEVRVFEIFQHGLFGTHPYGRSMYGTEKTVSSITPAMLREYHARAMAPGKMVLAVVGGASPTEVIELCERYLSPRGEVQGEASPIVPWTPQAGPRQFLKALPKEQSHIILGFPGTTLRSRYRFGMDVLVEILGGHGGRLFSAVREEQGLAYSVSAMSFEGIEPGYVGFYAGTMPGQESRVVAAMRAEADRLRRTPPSVSEVQRVIQHLIGSKAIAQQRTSARAAGMSLGYLYGLGYDSDVKYVNEISKITPEIVQRTARKFFRESHMVVACAGPGVQKLKLV